MTTLADGGQSIQVGNFAALLTDTAPVTVINTSLTDRIYLSRSSNLSAINGVPVEPGTAFTWESDGQLWAIIDPAATNPAATVVVTGAGTEWSASPVAVGTAVATLLLASGVPVVARTKNVFQGIAIGDDLPLILDAWIDVSGYQSLELAFQNGTANSPEGVLIQWADNVTQQALASRRADEWTPVGIASQSLSLPIRADWVKIVLHRTSAVNVLNGFTLTASSRTADRARTRASYPGKYSALNAAPLAAAPAASVVAFGQTVEQWAMPSEGRVAWSVAYNAAVVGTDVTVFAMDSTAVRYQLTPVMAIPAAAGVLPTFFTDSPLLATVIRIRNQAASGAATSVTPTATRVAI